MAPRRRRGGPSGSSPRAELDAGTVRFLAATDATRAVVQQVVKWGVIGWIAYMAQQSIASLAGNTTAIDVAVQFLLNTPSGITVTVSVGFGAVGVGYGWAERKLRERRTAQMGSRIRELELRIDPDRSGSGLGPKGTPGPRDAGV